MLPEYSLKGKVAFVSGAARGIGSGIAAVLAEAGATVAINSLTTRFLDPLVKEIKDRGGKAVGITGDLTSQDSATDTIKRAVAAVGEIDILVNNLGDSIRGDLVALPGSKDPVVSAADIQKGIAINLMHVIYCTQAVGPSMIAKRRGKVINVASVGGPVYGSDHYSIYAAGKAGIVGFTKTMAREWAPYGINVNGINPGLFPDPLTYTPEQIQMFAKMSEAILRPMGDKREVGLLALYLASDASNYMTGQMITLDGGISA